MRTARLCIPASAGSPTAPRCHRKLGHSACVLPTGIGEILRAWRTQRPAGRSSVDWLTWRWVSS